MLLQISLDQLTSFGLLLIRVSSFLFSAPFFSMRGVPAYFKMGLALFLSFIVYTSLSFPVVRAAEEPGVFFLLVVKEVLTGLLLGFIVSVVFMAVQMAGQLFDTQIGFSMVSVIDPQNGSQAPLIGNLQNLLFMLLFIGVDGPYGLITGLMQSYSFIPFGHLTISGSLLELLLKTVSAMFLLALKLSMPTLAALFLTDVAFAILARVVPQMNIYVVGMPLKIAVGFLALLFAMPAMVYLFQSIFSFGFQALDSLLRVLGGTV